MIRRLHAPILVLALVGTLAAPVDAGRVTGQASWYCHPGRSACTRGYHHAGMYAAAGPALRVGNWRGRVVRITGPAGSRLVRLVDWCACPARGRVADLYASTFRAICGPLSRGVCRVTVG